MSSPSATASRSPRNWLLPAAALLVVAGLSWWWMSTRGGDEAAAYRTEPVERGEIRTAISATGTLSATATVEIGTQVSGTLQSVEVDFNDVVSKGQVIARIDPSTLDARLEQASAALASSRANLNEAQAVARNAELDYSRKADLAARQLIARTDGDQARAARDQARARIASANAQVRQQQATVDSARLELEKSVIRSPVDGVVLLRAVEPGQTVAASLQTPVLFKIAGDLRKMEISLAIDEADIGQVREGQTARFTVDAFPDRSFNGRVKQVRLAATNTANVITYPVLVEVDNADQTLLPGMTANAEIEITRRPDVLSIPNAALRFRPAEESSAGGGPFGGGARNPAASTGNRAAGTREAGAEAAARGGPGGTGTADSLKAIAGKLGLDATQQAAFEQAAASMLERSGRRQAATGAAGAGAAQGEGRAQRGGNGGASGAGDRSRRLADRLKQNFAGFRATLSVKQQATWDAAITALTSGKRAPVYRLVEGKPEQLVVRIGATDGSRTELLGNELAEGDLVIVGGARPAP